MESHAGIESLLGWIKRECYDQIQGAQSWAELHRVMRANGLALQERGNGLVITADGGAAVKASSIGRDFSKKKLEARLGSFEQSPEHQAVLPPVQEYEQKPMRSRVDTVDLYARYKQDQQNTNASRTVERSRAYDRKKRMTEFARQKASRERSTIKLIQMTGLTRKFLNAAITRTLKNDLSKINDRYLRERQKIHGKYQRMAWADWLRAKATRGDEEALTALRAREACQSLGGDAVAGKGAPKSVQSHPGPDSVTKKGTVIYRFGATAVWDDGDKLNVSCGADQDGLEAVLRLAIERYGSSISVDGTSVFKEQIAQAAAAAKLPIIFDDASLERRRQELLRHTIPKEGQDEQGDQTDRGRTAGSSIVRIGPTATRTVKSYASHAACRAGKPDVGRIGRRPPPQSQNRLRRLSELGVVRIASRSEMLLQGDVSTHMEQQGSTADIGVRRRVPGAGSVSASLAAAEKYIAEREEKRQAGIDIPKHIRHVPGNDVAAAFAGTRRIDGQTLALLECGEEILVLPIDDNTARRLKRLALGNAITVTRQGMLRTKGRSR